LESGVKLAISVKGGVGKTTIAAMIVRHLVGTGKSILAVDADPNSCLGLVPGVGLQLTVAQLRKQAKTSTYRMDKPRTFEYSISQAITESNGFDLLTMGRPEGPGCYCAANNLLRNFLDKPSALKSGMNYWLLEAKVTVKMQFSVFNNRRK